MKISISKNEYRENKDLLMRIIDTYNETETSPIQSDEEDFIRYAKLSDLNKYTKIRGNIFSNEEYLTITIAEEYINKFLSLYGNYCISIKEPLKAILATTKAFVEDMKVLVDDNILSE